jgi:methylated-DNA-[protein]-cysteine S-methyltransferase
MANDKNFPSFIEKVLDLTKKIPSGKVTTYLEIAKKLGNPGLARAVGNALNKNPYILRIPCHRVIRTNGEVGGFAQGTDKKVKYLKRESVIMVDGKVKNLNKILFRYK